MTDPHWAWETYSLYGAAFQLMRLMLEEANKAGIENPLRLLIDSLADFRIRRKRSANQQEILAIIEKTLHIDPRQLGSLDHQAQESMVLDAAGELQRQDISGRIFHALNVLSCLDPEVDEESLAILLTIALSREQDELQKRLAAPALIRRI